MGFSKKALRKKIENELKNLETDQIDFLQWLFRTEPIDDIVRLQKLEEAKEEMNAAFQEFIREGFIGSIGTFPYTVPFGKAVSQKLPSVSGWITYFNVIEQENIQNLPDDHWMIGLRPLAAGNIFSKLDQLPNDVFNDSIQMPGLSKTESMIHLSLSYCLMHPRVKTNVLSVNSKEQAVSIKKILQNATLIEKEKLDVILGFLSKSDAAI